MQPTFIFDFRTNTVSVGGSQAASKALAEVVAAQRANIAKAMNVRTTVTKSA